MKVKIIAPFQIAGQADDGSVLLPEGTRLRGLYRLVHAPLYSRLLPVSVNGEQVPKSHKLLDGDLVIFVAPISGG